MLKKISAKITIMMVVMVIIATVVTAALCLSSYRSKVIQASEDQTKVIAAQASSRMDMVMTDAENLIYDIIFYIQAQVEKDKLLSKDPVYFAAFEKEVNDYVMKETDKLDNVLTTYVRYVPKLTHGTAGIFYTRGEDGKMSPAPPTDLAAYAEDDYEHVGWFYEPLQNGKASWLSPYYNANIDADMISYVVPFYINNEYFGVAGIDFSFEYIKELVEEQYTYNTGSFYILNEKGNIIFSRRDDMKGKNINELLDSKEVIRTIGSRTEKIISFKAQTNGENYTGSNYILSNNWTVGVMPTSKEVSADFTRTCITVVITVAIIIAIMCVLAVVFGNMMSKPITKLIGTADKIASGDLTGKIVATKDDEVGNLAKALVTMKESLRGIIGNVADETNSIVGVVGGAKDEIDEVSRQFQNVSNDTSKLYAGMESTANRTEYMKGETDGINKLLSNIEDKTERGKEMSIDISKRAEELRKNAENARDAAKNMNTAIDEALEKAIEDSKAIEQIGNLSSSMLEIASKTNLLSLNASIEAARAGESGRGFAVVASEISALASSSTETVNKIQGISNNVTEAVDSLSTSARQALDYIRNQVVEDYENMVHIGEQYYKDAEYIYNFVTEFKEVEQQLSSAMDNMVKSINEIANSSVTSAQATESIASSAKAVSEKTLRLVQSMEQTKNGCDKLINVMNRFTL